MGWSATLLLPVVAALVVWRGESATIDSFPVNTSVLLGDTAEFFCGVSGSQNNGEYLFWRKLPTFFISQDNTVNNATKFEVTEKYRLRILDVTLQDEGQYQCQLSSAFYEASLITNDIPTNMSVMWDFEEHEKKQEGDLTCQAVHSRPPATLRWFRDNTEITRGIVESQGEVDTQGYGNTTSSLALMLTDDDFEVTYRCQADIPAKENAMSYTFTFNSAPGVEAAILLIAASLSMYYI